MIREWWQAKKASYRRRALEDQQIAESISRSGKRLMEQSVVDGAWQRLISDYFERAISDPGFSGVGGTARRKNGGQFPFFDSEQQLGILRENSRLLCQTNQHAEGLLGGLLAYTIGTGSTVRVQPKKGLPQDLAEQAKALQTKAQEHVDQTAKDNGWTTRQQEFFTRSRRDGEVYLRLFHHDNGSTDIRFVWPEQLRKPTGTTTEEFAFGVRPDPDDGEKFVEYAVYPVNAIGVADPDIVPAEEMISVLCNVDTGVRRGIPDFCWGVADLLSSAGGLELAMGEGSKLQASIAYIRQHTNATPSSIQAFTAADPATQRKTDVITGREKYVRNYEAGMIVDTNQNTTFQGSPYNAGIAGHLEVSKLLVRSACVKWNAPFWLGSSDASDTNYASSLTAESPFVMRVKMIQQRYAEAFQKLFERVLRHAVNSGLLPANALDLLEVVVTLPNPETRNPLADAQKAAIEIPLGVDSRQQYADRQGRDYDRVLQDNQAYIQETGGMGDPLPLPTEGAGNGP